MRTNRSAAAGAAGTSGARTVLRVGEEESAIHSPEDGSSCYRGRVPRHQLGDVSIEVPRHWEDKTIVAFAAPARPGQTTSASFVMTRDSLGDADTLASYADRQLAEL